MSRTTARIPRPDQTDLDGDELGDACITDDDGDGIPINRTSSCPASTARTIMTLMVTSGDPYDRTLMVTGLRTQPTTVPRSQTRPSPTWTTTGWVMRAMTIWMGITT